MGCATTLDIQSNPDLISEADWIPVTGDEKELLSVYFPEVAFRTSILIPDKLLPLEDIEQGNHRIVILYDNDGQIIGYMRTIFAPITCLAGVCEAVRFSLTHDESFSAFDIFNPPGTEHRFKKYLDEEYSYFSESDFDRLRMLVTDPPEVLMNLTAEVELVEGVYATAPTRLQYQDWVVPGAAFTSFTVMNYGLTTERVLEHMNKEGFFRGNES